RAAPASASPASAPSSPSSRSDGIFACISLALPTARPGRAIRRNGSWRGTPIIHGGNGKERLFSQVREDADAVRRRFGMWCASHRTATVEPPAPALTLKRFHHTVRAARRAPPPRGPCRMNRTFRRLAPALLLALSVSAPALAAAPPPAAQVPGVYHHQTGALRVTALLDGTTRLSPALLAGIDTARALELLERGFVPGDAQGAQTAVNAFLVHAGDALVLVDAGTGDCFGPGLGQVPGNLRAAGYAPAQV